MAENQIKTAWLHDEEGANFAPKTLVESIQDAEGVSLNDRLASAGMSAEVEGTRLKLGTGGGAGSNHTYSTEEQVVGTWIDGKPIYEKVYVLESQLNISSNFWTRSPIENTNIQTFIQCFSEADLGVSMPLAISNNKREWADGYARILNFRSSSVLVDKIIVQYTKITD